MNVTLTKKSEKEANLLKALGHPVRLCIVKGLLKNRCNVTDIVECLKVPQATVSQHLTVLKAAGIVKGERNGLQICYEIANKTVSNIVNSLN